MRTLNCRKVCAEPSTAGRGVQAPERRGRGQGQSLDACPPRSVGCRMQHAPGLCWWLGGSLGPVGQCGGGVGTIPQTPKHLPCRGPSPLHPGEQGEAGSHLQGTMCWSGSSRCVGTGDGAGPCSRAGVACPWGTRLREARAPHMGRRPGSICGLGSGVARGGQSLAWDMCESEPVGHTGELGRRTQALGLLQPVNRELCARLACWVYSYIYVCSQKP